MSEIDWDKLFEEMQILYGIQLRPAKKKGNLDEKRLKKYEYILDMTCSRSNSATIHEYDLHGYSVAQAISMVE